MSLQKQGEKAVLQSDIKPPANSDQKARINLKIKIPETIKVDITDGSGSITIESVQGDLTVKDGSGSLTIVEIDGYVTVSDGSGSIAIQDVKKNVFIVIREEGSGLVEVEGVKGKVTIRP